MGHSALVEALLVEAQAVLAAELARVGPTLASGDLAQIETALQGVSRQVCGRMVEATVRLRSAQETGVPVCAGCGGPLRRVALARPRQVVGLVGDYVVRRAYWHWAACRQGQAPFDAGDSLWEAQKVVCPWGQLRSF